MHSPELSIIVPVLNERETLSGLFRMLGRQRGVCFELALVDGGSTDGGPDVARRMAKDLGYPLLVHEQPGGKARQLNAGAARVGAPMLLFLHADSDFPDPDALRRALDAYTAELTPGEPLAGHFRLCFQREEAPYSFGYYFWEWKARLDRPDCTHGDQGILVLRDHFDAIGPFDEDALIAQETLWAERLRRNGRWLLLPSEIKTSARRFESEGLAQRQTLNALLMNFAAIGWTDFFQQARGIYRQQRETSRLDLGAVLDLVDNLLQDLPLARRLRLWLDTGRYVRKHAWQIPFSLDARLAFWRGLAPGEGSTSWLSIHDRWFDRLTGNPAGEFGAAFLAWCWFRLFKIRHQRRH